MKKDIFGHDGVRRYQENGKWVYYASRGCLPPEVIFGLKTEEDYFRSIFPDYDEKRAGDPVAIEPVKKERVQDEFILDKKADRLDRAAKALLMKKKNPKLTQKELAKDVGLYDVHTDSLDGAARMLRRLWAEMGEVKIDTDN